MVSSTTLETVFSPQSVLKGLYKQALSDHREHDLPGIVATHFSSAFARDTDSNLVPSVDLLHPPGTHQTGSLVKFRGMVQDTSCSPETVDEAFRWGFSLGADDGFQNINIIPNTHASPKLSQRDILWAVNIPGEPYWMSSSSSSIETHQGNQRCQYQQPHKYPHPEAHIALQLKIYDSSAESLKVCETHEFYGLLAFEHRLSIDEANEEAGTIAVIHVLFHKPLQNPYDEPSMKTESSKESRELTLEWLSSSLGEDRDAAEWVLLSLLSYTESRNPPIFPLHVALTNLPRPPSGAPDLCDALKEILPRFSSHAIDLNFLNTTSFSPESKDEDLHAGVLQVPHSTILLMTEFDIGEGHISEKGMENIQAVNEICESQTLNYKFPFSRYAFPTDTTIISCTDGKSSLLFKSNVTVPLHNVSSKRTIDAFSMDDHDIQRIRSYIVGARQHVVTVEKDVAGVLKDTFVEERRRDPSYTQEDFARQLTIARLISRSQWRTKVTWEDWQYALSLDRRRMERVKQC